MLQLFLLHLVSEAGSCVALSDFTILTSPGETHGLLPQDLLSCIFNQNLDHTCIRKASQIASSLPAEMSCRLAAITRFLLEKPVLIPCVDEEKLISPWELPQGLGYFSVSLSLLLVTYLLQLYFWRLARTSCSGR